jgi:hypothetical protein
MPDHLQSSAQPGETRKESAADPVVSVVPRDKVWNAGGGEGEGEIIFPKSLLAIVPARGENVFHDCHFRQALVSK